MNIKYSDFVILIAVTGITLSASFMLASVALSVKSDHGHKISDVTYVENSNDINDREEIDEIYEFPEIELTHEQKQQIMEQKDVITENEIHEDASLYSSQQVALTTDDGVYIANVETAFPNILPKTTMTLVTFILFSCMSFATAMIDDTGYKFYSCTFMTDDTEYEFCFWVLGLFNSSVSILLLVCVPLMFSPLI